MTRTLVCAVLGCALCMFSRPTAARIMDGWDYERLFKESDLIVIARAAETEDSKDKNVDHALWGLEFVGMNTTFDVKHALKGKADKTIKVLHYKFGRPIDKDRKPDVIIDGPSFVTFRHDKFKLEGGKYTIPQPSYLLFLKKRADGRYEPVSGEVDPQLSVKEVFDPMLPELGGCKAD
jgi:hypothetical protein